MLTRFRTVVLLSIPLILAFTLIAIPAPSSTNSLSPAVAHGAAYEADVPPVDPGFGPALLLLTLPDQAALGLLPPTVSLHAMLDAELGLYIASGGPDDGTAASEAGIDTILLEAKTEGRRYYLADGQQDQARALASALADVLYDAGHTLLLAADADQERALVEALSGQGVPVSLVSSAPLQLPDGDTVYAASIDPISSADPFIDGLLAQLNTADLAAIIGDLSGENPVTLGSEIVTIDTRYTFSTRMDESERYILQTYEQMGLAAQAVPWTYGAYSGNNIVAEIEGLLNPEQVWLIGGHFDSNSDDPYNHAPGADDNATGTASTLLIAQILLQADLADTIRFIHFSGEEQGQWGSRQYVNALASDETILGFINLDMIGWDGDGDRVAELHTGTGELSNQLGTAMIEAGAAYSQGLSFERKMTSASRFSDHSPFWDAGYASFLAIENFFYDSIPGDHSPWYHSTGDTLEHVDLDYVLAYARTALATIGEVAGAAENIDPPTPTPTLEPPTTTPTSTPRPSGCTDLIANGGWEESGGWRYGTTPYSARIISQPVHAGAYALQQGIPSSVTNRLAHSSTFQQVTIPADVDSVELRFWARPGGSGDGVDFREVRLLTTSYGNLAQIERDTSTGNAQWQEKVFDLSAYRGQTVVLYFNVYNNGSGSQLWTHIDEVALLACSGDAPTVTPTSTATSTALPSATPIASATTTAISSATSTVMPSRTPTPTATSVADTPTPTPTSTMTSTPIPSSTPMETPTSTATATSMPGPVFASPSAIELDLRQGEFTAAITFDDGGVSQPWQAETDADWISLAASQGMTDEELALVLKPFNLPSSSAALTGTLELTGLQATSSISITFPARGETTAVDVTATYGEMVHWFYPMALYEYR